MSLTDSSIAPSAERISVSERHDVILDAFERCIVRSGFHRTTMQDVAKEAGMSAGNLYRYFTSKAQLVSGMCGRDRERFGSEVETVVRADNVMQAFAAMGHKHLVEKPRSRCIQLLEIWAEAARNPEIAAICEAIDCEVSERFVGVIEAAKARGQVAAHVDAPQAMSALSAMADGFFMRRALDPAFDPEDGFRLLIAVMEGLFGGKIVLPPASVPPTLSPPALPALALP